MEQMLLSKLNLTCIQLNLCHVGYTEPQNKRKKHEKMVVVLKHLADTAELRRLKTAMHVHAVSFLNTCQPLLLAIGYKKGAFRGSF